MAELSGFAYLPGGSYLHRMDIRVKMAALMVVGVTALGASPIALGEISVLLAAAAVSIRLPLPQLAAELRYASVLVLLVFAARTLTTPGEDIFRFLGASVTVEGLRQGGLVCWRLMTVIAAGVLFVVTSPVSHVKAGAEWFLRPVPGIPEKRVATMLSLVVRFIPVIFQQVHDTRAAQQSRCAELRKNPFRRMVILTAAALRRTFAHADQLAAAMEARCYGDARTPKPLAATPADGIALLVTAGVALAAWWV